MRRLARCLKRAGESAAAPEERLQPVAGVFLRAEHAEHGVRRGIADGDLIVWGKAAVNVKEK